MKACRVWGWGAVIHTLHTYHGRMEKRSAWFPLSSLGLVKIVSDGKEKRARGKEKGLQV
jgi:hypothetical protein